MSRRRPWYQTLLRQPWWVATAFTALVLSSTGPAMERLNLTTYDGLDWALSRLRPAPIQQSVVIAIDNDSLRQLGPWPWPRALQAQVIDALTRAGVRAVGYDVLLPSHPGASGNDTPLADAIRRNGRVVLPIGPAARAFGQGPTPLGPAPVFGSAAAGIGHVDSPMDADGLNRRLALSAGFGPQEWAALPLAVLNASGLRSTPSVTADLFLPADTAATRTGWWRQHELLMHTLESDLPMVSAAALLADPRVGATLAGKVAWVGVTAEGADQPVSVPAVWRGVSKSAVQFHAQAMESMLHQGLVRPVDGMTTALINLIPLGVLALLAAIRPLEFRARSALALTIAPLGMSLLLLTRNWWLPTAALSAGLALAFLLQRARELLQTRHDLRRTRDQAHATLQAITEAVVTLDRRLRIRYLNPSAERLSGRARGEVRHKALHQLFALRAPDMQVLIGAVQQCLQEARVIEITTPLRLFSPRGERLVRLVASPIVELGPDTAALDTEVPVSRTGGDTTTFASEFTRETRAWGAVLALSDVTDTVRSAERLQHQATHDALTQLPNRTLVRQRLQQALQQASRTGRQAAVLFVDLDRFKRINDSLGHRFGDTLLRGVARRLREHCGEMDLVGRWGGDEFVIIQEGVGSREDVAQRALDLINAVSREFSLDGVDVECGCCIGIALAPQDSLDPDTLIVMADTAMYRGKALGGKHHAFYSSEMSAWTRESLSLESRLRRGLHEASFELHYQPQVDLTDLLDEHPIVGMEALLRWRQPDGTLWGPGRFLGLTEDSGLILPLGGWVIEESCRQMARWLAADIPVVPVSINVSARQCLDRSLPRTVLGALERHRVPARLLKIEVTESTAMSDLGHLNSLLGELRMAGVKVSLDDFGSGYSSLAHLKRFPIDQIKIDPGFVKDIESDAHSAAIVRATIALAHGLGLPVVAEGVESPAQLEFLLRHGCDVAQGFHFSPALPAEEVARYLQASTRGPVREWAVPIGPQPGGHPLH